MVAEIIDDMKFRSRRFLLSAFSEAYASVVALFLVIMNVINTGDPMPALWWWASVTSAVLALYGATVAIGKPQEREGT